MISIKRYLDSDSPDSGQDAEAVRQDPFAAALDAYGSSLLEMGNCSMDACPGLGDDLKHSLGRLKAELSPLMRPEKLAAHGEQAREQLRAWGRGAARHYQGKAREVKEMLLTMARTAESVSARDQRSAGQMSAVTERLRAIATLEDLTEIRASIDKSAAELKTSIDRMTEEGKEVLDHLKKQVEGYQTKLEEAEKIASRDALTGVSSRVYVEGQIEKRIESGATFCVATSGSSASSDTSGSSATISANDFLTLLVTEMQNQDPTSDTDPNEYINQLVQVNSLEQLIDINQTLSTDAGSSSSTSGTGATPQAAGAASSLTNSATPASIAASPHTAAHLGGSPLSTTAGAAASSTSAPQTVSTQRISGNLSAPNASAAARRVGHALAGRTHAAPGQGTSPANQ